MGARNVNENGSDGRPGAVVPFPKSRRPNTIEGFLAELGEAKDLIEEISVVVTSKEGLCSVFTFNADAGSIAVHALCLENEAKIACGITPDPEESP